MPADTHDPALSLQGAIVAALRSSPALAALVGSRICDAVPETVAFPYVEIGETQAVSDDTDCWDGFEIFATLHVWSRAVGRPEAASIAGLVRDILHGGNLALSPAWTLVEIRHQNTRHLKDPDGKTSHAVLAFRALIDPAF